MRPARVLSFGSIPPEWGGPLRGGVATFHATLVGALVPGSDPLAEIAGVVVAEAGDTSGAPVPVHAPAPGQDRVAFVEALLAEVRPDVAVLQHLHLAWGVHVPQVAPDLPIVGISHSWHAITLVADAGAREQARERVQRALDRLRVLVVPSEHTRQEGLALGLRYPADTRVVPYPLQPAFTAPVDVGRPRSGIAFAAGLTARKNPAALLDAVALLDGVELDLVGEGPDAEALAEQAAALGIADRVRAHGAAAAGELRELLAGAEVLCVPSLSESFGIVYIEALACGTPVVGFGPTVREIRQAMGIQVGIGLARTSAEAIASGIEQVRSASWDRELLRSAAVRAFDTAAISHRHAAAFADAAGPLAPARADLERRVAAAGRWHYAIDLGEGVVTPIADPARAARHEWRREYLFEPLLEACGGSLAGKRVLDLGCNAGFWSLAAAEAGCEFVLGIDGRARHLEQARLVMEARRVDPMRFAFRHADVFEYEPAEVFDVVLCLGLLYHVDRPVELFERLGRWTRELAVVDTTVAPGEGAGFALLRESPEDPRNALASPFVLRPTLGAVLELAAGAGFEARVLAPATGELAGLDDYRDGLRYAVLLSR